MSIHINKTKKTNSFPILVMILILFLLITSGFFVSIINANKNNNPNESIRIAYITDLNFYPTPQKRASSHPIERENGLLIYESNAIFQQLLSYLNKNFDIDFILFGGNNIANYNSSSNIDTWNTFLEILDQVESEYLIVYGKNERESISSSELIKALKKYGNKSQGEWWSYNFKNFLIVGLDSTIFDVSDALSKEQISWLKETLSKNQDKKTFVFLHRPIIDIEGNSRKISYVNELFEILKKNPQVKLVGSGSELVNRYFIKSECLYLIGASPIAYPCVVNLIEASENEINVKRVNIPLKGIVKKAEKSLVESDRARVLFPTSPKSIRTYVLGKADKSKLVL